MFWTSYPLMYYFRASEARAKGLQQVERHLHHRGSHHRLVARQRRSEAPLPHGRDRSLIKTKAEAVDHTNVGRSAAHIHIDRERDHTLEPCLSRILRIP